MSTKIRTRKSRVVVSKKKAPPAEPLDKKDEVWCYVLIKLFTAMLEDPEEAKRLTKPSKSAFDVDLEPAVQQLKAAIDRKKSEHSAKMTNKKSQTNVSSDTAESSSYDVTASASRPSSAESSTLSSSAAPVDLKSIFKALSKIQDTKSGRSKGPSRTMSRMNNFGGLGDRNSFFSSIINTLSADRG